MYYKASALACLICVISSSSLATPFDAVSAGGHGFKRIVVDISRVNRANCAPSRPRCLAVNQKKTRIVLIADQFLAQDGQRKYLFGSVHGLAGQHATLGRVAGGSYGSLPLPGLADGGSITGGSLIGGGGESGSGESDGGSSGTPPPPQPSVVPLPSSAYFLILALSLGLLGQSVKRRAKLPPIGVQN